MKQSCLEKPQPTSVILVSLGNDMYRPALFEKGDLGCSSSCNSTMRSRMTCGSQRRVTFHLPDGSQESCSDSGLGDHEPVGGGMLISHPLPLVQPQDEFYDQASPDKRTEADGNSDPNSGE
ncbi:PCDH9 protein, partial [Polyodon spathula]|nr:PCDH9 protein [Polyodon spathula]